MVSKGWRCNFNDCECTCLVCDGTRSERLYSAHTKHTHSTQTHHARAAGKRRDLHAVPAAATREPATPATRVGPGPHAHGTCGPETGTRPWIHTCEV